MMFGQTQGAALQQGVKMKQPSQVWIQDENGKLHIVFIEPGVSSDFYTEVLRGELKEGQKIVIGAAGGPNMGATPGRPGQPGPGPMMFMGR